MPRAGIALGSNLGDSAAQLEKAAALLADASTPGEPFLRAPIYRTAPVNCPPASPDFLNTVVEIDFGGGPLELLQITQGIERQLGRVPNPVRNAPRPIDVDILYLGDIVFENDSLALPHPRITERLFVLEPLAAIRPDLILPGQTQSVAELRAAANNALRPEDVVKTTD
jgi:2-amino-4-hydroxy-6-hydroxymethyldihydropteridine diphosphokinase